MSTLTINLTNVQPLDTILTGLSALGYSGNAGLYIKVNATADGFEFAAAGGGGSAFADNAFQVYDNVDNTKILAFQASGITTGTTRTLTVPDASGTIALTSDLSAYLTTAAAASTYLTIANAASTYATIANLSSYVPYSGATGAVNLGANNLTVDTNLLFVDATNNRVGIGTVTPSGTFQISVDGSSTTLPDNIFRLETTTNNAYGPAMRFKANTASDFYLAATGTLNAAGAGYFQIYDGILNGLAFKLNLNNFVIGSSIVKIAGETSSFPALKRSSTELQVRLADDSAFAPLKSSRISLSSGIIYTDSAQVEIRDGGTLAYTNIDAALYKVSGTSGFTGTGAYTNFTIVGGIITAAS